MVKTVEEDAAEVIREAGHGVLRVCHVSSAGDSGEDLDIALYLAPGDVCMTARLWVEIHKPAGMAAKTQHLQHVEVTKGWD